MPEVALQKIVKHCDTLLKTREIEDWSGAVNGLQMENSGQVTRIAATVDASLVTANLAVDAEADLLIVHHGFFWSKTTPWTGRRYELLRVLMDNDMAVYSSHLPLDCHPRIGNNAGLGKALRLTKPQPFFSEKGRDIGLKYSASLTRAELRRRLEQAVDGPVVELPGGAEKCRKIGIVTGGAGAEITKAAAEGVDTFITGEGPHWTFALAEDLGINVFYAGHYATETFGVKSLAAHLAKKFGLPWVFLDHPTGL